ncbi:MAG: DMT family transporter [Candidatus Thiodiazotropha sp.]
MKAETAKRYKGVLIMIVSVLALSLMDGIGKVQSGVYPEFQILFLRTLPIVLLALLAIFLERKKIQNILHVNPHCLYLQSLRGIAWAASGCFFYFAFAKGNLTYVYILSFLHPIFGQIFSYFWLRRPAKKYTYIPLTIMFAGVIVGAQGSSEIKDYSVLLLAVIAAFFFSLEFILAEEIQEKHPEINDKATLFYSSIIGLFIFIAIAFIAAPLFKANEYWVTPTSFDFGLIFLQGFFGGLGNLGIIIALRYAESRIIAPWDYMILFFGVIIDFVWFGHQPNLHSIVSGLVIISGGLWLLGNDIKNTTT